MKRKNSFALFSVLLFCSIFWTSCKKENNPVKPPPTDNFTGNFLAWTGSSDSLHYFNLVRINGSNGTVTNIGGNDFFTDLQYGPDGTLYGIASELCIINPNDGTTTTVGDFHYKNKRYILMSGAAFSPNGNLYVRGVSTDSIFSVNLSNAELTYIGLAAELIWDIEFTPDGTLYGSFAELYKLNANDMSTSSTIGRFSYEYIQSMTFGKGHTLYGISSWLMSQKLYSINTQTAQLTTVTSVSCNDIWTIVAERTPILHKQTLPKNNLVKQRVKTKEELIQLENLVKQQREHKMLTAQQIDEYKNNVFKQK